MKRLATLWLLASICLGCQARPSALDPFMGRSTVPPPGTGSYGAPGVAPPYYAPPAGAAGAAIGPKPAAIAQQPTPAAAPTPTPATPKPAETQSKVVPASHTAGPKSGVVHAVHHAEPTPAKPEVVQASASAPQAAKAVVPSATTPSSTSAIKILDMPTKPTPSTAPQVSRAATTASAPLGEPRQLPTTAPATQVASAAGTPTLAVAGRSASSGANPAAATASSPAAAAKTSGSAGRNFSYDPEYKWLKGRLEYSESQRRWKLRYIPIDGTTDEYGGSVVLADADKISGFQAGDYVSVYGDLAAAPTGSRSFAPDFKVQRIERQ